MEKLNKSFLGRKITVNEKQNILASNWEMLFFVFNFAWGAFHLHKNHSAKPKFSCEKADGQILSYLLKVCNVIFFSKYLSIFAQCDCKILQYKAHLMKILGI